MSIQSLRFCSVAFLLGVSCFVAGTPKSWAVSADVGTASHKQVRVIRPEFEGTAVRLNTFAMSPQGDLWMCCDMNAATAEESDDAVAKGCILVYGVDGSQLKSIKLEFAPQAINFSDDGVPFVAGNGKVARLKPDGEVDIIIEAPNMLPEEELKTKLRAKNEAMITRMLEGSEAQLKRLEEQIAKLEEGLKETESDEADAEDATRKRLKTRNETRLSVLKQQLEFQKQMLDQQKTAYEGMFGGDVSIAQVARSTGIAVASQDIFVSLPSIEGQGYAVYRMTHDLAEPKLVVDSLSGCCGQLDIQSDGVHLIVAENSAFKVRYLDREGEDVRSFGERSDARFGGNASPAGWGSCCNPMNVRCVDDKEILVAESSIGHIKRYTPTGEFLGLVGTATIAGGCKHVAIAKDAKRDWYFMMNTAGNNVAVLVPLSEAPAETDDERDARLAMEGLGQQLIGVWKAEPKKAVAASKTDADQEADADADESDANEEEVVEEAFDYNQYLLDQNRYLRLDANGKVSRTEAVAAVAKTAEAPKGLFGAIASLFSGESQSSAQVIPEEDTRWVAVRQAGDVVHFSLVESGVSNYVIAVRFLDDERAEFKWYYDEVAGEPMVSQMYRKVAAAPPAEACDAATCKGAECDKPNCDHSKAGGDSKPSDEASLGANDEAHTATPVKE